MTTALTTALTTATSSAMTATAEAVVAAVVARDGEALRGTLTDDVQLEALLPRGLLEGRGPDEVSAAFARWFGDLARFDLVAATAGEIGPRLHLRWRFRAVFADGSAHLVEQQLYADTAGGRLSRIRLLCSGFCGEEQEST